MTRLWVFLYRYEFHYRNCGEQSLLQPTHITDCVQFKWISYKLHISASAASYGGGVVRLSGLIDNVNIINCTFQNNNVTYGGAVRSDG